MTAAPCDHQWTPRGPVSSDRTIPVVCGECGVEARVGWWEFVRGSVTASKA